MGRPGSRKILCSKQ